MVSREVAGDNRRARVAGGFAGRCLISAPGQFRRIDAKPTLRLNLSNRKSSVSSVAWASVEPRMGAIEAADGMTPSLFDCFRIALSRRTAEFPPAQVSG